MRQASRSPRVSPTQAERQHQPIDGSRDGCVKSSTPTARRSRDPPPAPVFFGSITRSCWSGASAGVKSRLSHASEFGQLRTVSRSWLQGFRGSGPTPRGTSLQNPTTRSRTRSRRNRRSGSHTARSRADRSSRTGEQEAWASTSNLRTKRSSPPLGPAEAEGLPASRSRPLEGWVCDPIQRRITLSWFTTRPVPATLFAIASTRV